MAWRFYCLFINMLSAFLALPCQRLKYIMANIGYCVVCINFLECEQEPLGQFLSKDDIPKHMSGPFVCNEYNEFLTKPHLFLY